MRSAIFTIGIFLTIVAGAQKQQQLLHIAYQKKSITDLHLFLDRWSLSVTNSKRIAPVTQNDTIKNLQELFIVYYKNAQSDLFSISNANSNNYILLDDAIRYSIIDSLEICNPENACDYQLPGNEIFTDIFAKSYANEKTIQPFIPDFHQPGIKLLLLTESYRRLIDSFLELKKKASINANHQAVKVGHDPEKVKFLGNLLPLQKRHWGEYWNYMSYPLVRSIIFDKGLCHAVINFWNSSSGGVTYCRKESGNWKIINSRTLISQ